LDFQTAAHIAAVVTATINFIRFGRETYEQLLKTASNDPLTSEIARALMGSYSPEEVEAIERRLKGCRDRAIKQGGGEDRHSCICSVLDEVRLGNGGWNGIESWRRQFEAMNCA
jgi:hypothetical protein